jgi:hypothetical protein
MYDVLHLKTKFDTSTIPTKTIDHNILIWKIKD